MNWKLDVSMREELFGLLCILLKDVANILLSISRELPLDFEDELCRCVLRLLYIFFKKHY